MIDFTNSYEDKIEKLKAQKAKAEQTRDNAIKKIENLKKQIAELKTKSQQEIFNQFMNSLKEKGLNSPEDVHKFLNRCVDMAKPVNPATNEDSESEPETENNEKTEKADKPERKNYPNYKSKNSNEDTIDILGSLNKNQEI